MAPLRRFLHRLIALFRVNRAEAELAREVDAHLRLLEDTFLAQGMSAEEARYAARRAFGGVEQAKERQRDARSFRWLAGWPMDLKLGARMLIKTPGLTVIAVAALAVAIGCGAAYLEFLNDMFRPTLPIPHGERVVGILNWDAEQADVERRTLYDFAIWRNEVRSIEHLGAYVALERNLITEDGRGEPVEGVEISASAFRVAPTPPLLGRPLIDADEAPRAPPVVVIGHALWQSRFGADPGVIGRTVRLGSMPHTVVGVMPAGFGFPVRQMLWVPLRFDPSQLRRAEGPGARVFGRLAPGVPIETAQAELAAIAARVNSAAPETNQNLRPQVKPYVKSLWASRNGRLQTTILYTINLFFLGLLGICGANVATLVFARTATRQGEITVRTALGASRGRIVAQLFAEALVLASIAAVVGLGAARFGVPWLKNNFMVGQEITSMPFWWNDALSPTTILYGVALALLAAAITGVLPALKSTGPEMQARLKEAAAGGSTMKFGRMWTAVIVGQVALTVVFLSSLAALSWSLIAGPGPMHGFAFPPREVLTLRLALDRETVPGRSSEAADAAHRARLEATYEELERTLTAEPGVAGVTYANVFPGRGFEFVLEIEGMPSTRSADDPLWARSAVVAPDYFQTLGVPVIAGRDFTDGDKGRHVAIVDQTFVQRVLGGRDPIGMRLRRPKYSENPTPGPWYEIVGVVKDLSIASPRTSDNAVLYRAGAAGAEPPFRVLVRAQGNPAEVAPAIRRAAAAADPTLRVYDLMPFERIEDADIQTQQFFATVVGIVGAVALLLATAGIYALMSFTLARRTREIGIRAALGADPRRILRDVFSRAFAQVALGVLIGTLPGAALLLVGIAEASGGTPWLAIKGCAAAGAFTSIVAMLACVVPARRALCIEPTDALRVE